MWTDGASATHSSWRRRRRRVGEQSTASAAMLSPASSRITLTAVPTGGRETVSALAITRLLRAQSLAAVTARSATSLKPAGRAATPRSLPHHLKQQPPPAADQRSNCPDHHPCHSGDQAHLSAPQIRCHLSAHQSRPPDARSSYRATSERTRCVCRHPVHACDQGHGPPIT